MTLLQYVLDAIYSAQNEILLFIMALMIHRIAFRKNEWKSNSRSSKTSPDTSQVKASARCNKEVACSSAHFTELQDALNDGDLQMCMDRLGCLKHACSKGMSSMPAVAGVVLEQTTRLAIQQRTVTMLLQQLHQLGLIEHTMDTVLVECIQGGHMTEVQEVAAFRQAQRLEFGDTAYSALIKDAMKPDVALRLFMEAAALRNPSDDLLKAASASALEHSNAPLANAVLQSLPLSAPPEAVCNLLRFFAVPAGTDTDSELLRMYKTKFEGVDLSGDMAAMRAVATAATRLSVPQVLKDLMAVTHEPAQVMLLKDLATRKQLPTALNVLRASPHKGTWLFNAAIEACIECRSIEDAEQVLAEAGQCRLADVTSYNMIVKAYSQMKKPQKARQAVEVMMASGLSPNGATYNAMLDAAVQVNLEATWKVFDDMTAAGLRPNRITCTVLLKAMRPGTKAADIERIIAVLDQIHEDVDDVLLSSIVDACIRANRPELLTARLKKYRASGKSTDILQITRAHTYGNIIRAYGFVHDLDMVWEIWQEMLRRQVTPAAVTLGCMVEALATNGDPDAAHNLINNMFKYDQWRPLINAVIFASVLKGYSHEKRFDKVWQVYQEMLGHKLQFSSNTFNVLIDACARNSEMSRIPALLKDMRAQGILPCVMTYGAIVKGCCQENRIEEAFAVVKDMVQNTSCCPDEIMYNTLLDGCARKGLYEVGMTVLDEMQQNGIVPTNFTLSVAVKLATRSLIGSRSEKVDKAFELCETISTKYRFKLNVHVYDNLVNTCILNKDLNRAFEVVGKMLSDGVRADLRGYQLMIRACVANNRPHDAAGLIRAATGLSGKHPKLEKFAARLLQPQGGLPAAFVEEAIEGIVRQCHQEKIGIALITDLQAAQVVKLDPRLHFRLATDLLK